VIALSALAVALEISCSRSDPGTLRVLCGSSMAAPMQELAKAYTQKTGTVVEFDLGGSETLLPKILAGAEGDVFVCHDPFEQKVRDGKRCDHSVAVGYLQPVLAVQPGNPQGLRNLADLASPGLRIGIGDPRYSTCGELFLRALDQRGITERVMPQIVQQARSPSEVANGLLVGALDAAVIWNFSAALYAERVEVVEVGLTYPETRVTLIALAGSANPKRRDGFLQWCSQPEALEVFLRHGYTKNKYPG
jgi:molybdate transport system substrate-binding protein